MISLMPTTCDTQEVTVVERAEGAVAAAADHLAVRIPELPEATLGCQLDDMRQLLEQRLAQSGEPADDSATTAELLISILRLRCELLDEDLSRRFRCLTEIRNALSDLRGLSPREMIYAAPVVLSREFGFARTMISTVRGSMWRAPAPIYRRRKGRSLFATVPRLCPRRPHPTGGCAAGDRTHPQAVRSLRAVAERRQTHVQRDRQCFRLPWVYCCPDHRRGRAIGMLHADRPEHEGVVTMRPSRPVGGLCRVPGGGVRECGARREGRPTTR